MGMRKRIELIKGDFDLKFGVKWIFWGGFVCFNIS